MNRRPFIVILHVELGAALQELLQDNPTVLWTLRENIHDQVHRAVAILVSDIQVGALGYQRVHNRVIEPHDAQVKWAAEDPAALIDVRVAFNKLLRGRVVLLSDREAQRCALVLVEHVGVDLVHEEPVDDASVAIRRRLMQDSPLPVIPKVLVECLLGEVLQEGDQRTLLHVVFKQQVQQLEEGVHEVAAMSVRVRDFLGLRGHGVLEPLEAELLEIAQLDQLAGNSREVVVRNVQYLKML